MRPIPAQRIGHAHGLLRALDQRGRLRLEEFVTEFEEGDLFPSGLENTTGRTRQYIAYARAAGLVNEDRGAVELTDLGRRYVKSSDPRDPFAVSPGQAEWLRRQLRERHLTDSIFNGAAIGLSLYSTLPDGEWVSLADFGRAAAHLGRAGWDNENTFRSQGERITLLLQDMELVDEHRAITEAGRQTRAELRLPLHVALHELARQLNPGGAEGAAADAAAERAELGLSAPGASAAEPEAPADPPAAEADEADAGGEGEWATVIGQAVPAPDAAVGPIEAAALAAAQAAQPPVPEPDPPADPADQGGAPVQESEPQQTPAGAPDPLSGGDPQGPGERPAVDARPPDAPPPAPAAGPPPPATPAPAEDPPPAPPPSAPVSPADSPSRIAMRPTTAMSALRPEDLAAWKAEQESAQAPSPAGPAAAGNRPFLDIDEVRRAAEKRGLKLDHGVYAAAIAALASGRHLVLTGGPGFGKTSLALAIAEAAVRQGRCEGVLFTAAGGGWSGREMLGQRTREGGYEDGLVPQAIAAQRWLVIDELDRTRLDRALGRASTILAGQAIDVPGRGEVKPPPQWRVIGTMADIEEVGRATPALRRRFVFVEMPPLERATLEELATQWAGGDEVAAAVGRRLAAINDVVPLGPALYRDAVAYVKARRALGPADETDLTLEALAGFVLPQLEGAGDEVAARAVQAAGLGG